MIIHLPTKKTATRRRRNDLSPTSTTSPQHADAPLSPSSPLETNEKQELQRQPCSNDTEMDQTRVPPKKWRRLRVRVGRWMYIPMGLFLAAFLFLHFRSNARNTYSFADAPWSSLSLESSTSTPVDADNEHDRWAAYLLAQKRYEKRLLNGEVNTPGMEHLGHLNRQQTTDKLHPPKTQRLLQKQRQRRLQLRPKRPVRPTNTIRHRPTTKILNMMRIPKAGSTFLSVTGRALAGCQPDGFPCCLMTANLKHPGVCPRHGLDCSRQIQGCLGHNPNFNLREVPMITQLRNVAQRTVSSFFYGGSHNELPCPAADRKRQKGLDVTPQDVWPCFQTYVQTDQYANVMVQMLNSSPAYKRGLGLGTSSEKAQHAVETAKKRLCSFAWFGFVEMPLASNLLLYEMEPFRQLVPNPVVFELSSSVPRGSQVADQIAAAAKQTLEDPTADHDHMKKTTKTNTRHAKEENEEGRSGHRKNKDVTYEHFTTSGPYVEQDGEGYLHKYNQADVEVYEFALGLFCARLGASGLLEEIRGGGVFLHRHHVDLCLDSKWEGKNVDTYCPSK